MFVVVPRVCHVGSWLSATDIAPLLPAAVVAAARAGAVAEWVVTV